MKKLLTILVLIMLIISFFQITSMYALYKEQIQGEYNTLLGAWEIKVNAKDVTTSGQVEAFTISDSQLEYVSSNYIQAGKIAPSGQAYFDIVIDPSDTDVSIVYTIDIDTDATSSTNSGVELANALKLISVENYFGQGNDGQTNKTTNTTTYTNGNLYTSVIPIDMIVGGYKNYVRIYFEWANVEANNALDEVLGETEIEVETEVEGETVTEIESAKLTVPLQINLKQYIGEDISNES